MSCFCCLCEWEIILKIFCSFFFPYFELHQLAIIHFMTWMCVPRLAGSPNLAGKQENHLESLLEKGGLHSVLRKLLLAAGWIVYHTLVPLFLDVSWASVLTEGEWQYWSRDSSIKHGREGKAEDSSWLKGDSTLRFSSLLYHRLFHGILLPLRRLGVDSHICGHFSSLFVLAAERSDLKPDIIHIDDHRATA